MQLTTFTSLTHPVTHSDMTRTPEYCGNVSFQVTGDHCPASNASDLSVACICLCGFISRCHSGPPFLHNEILHILESWPSTLPSLMFTSKSPFLWSSILLKYFYIMLSSHSGSDNLNIPDSLLCGFKSCHSNMSAYIVRSPTFTRTTAEPQLPERLCLLFLGSPWVLHTHHGQKEVCLCSLCVCDLLLS